MERLAGILLWALITVIGLGLLIGIVATWDSADFDGRGEHVSGKVVGVEAAIVRSDAQPEDSVIYYPTVRFTTKAGRRLEVRAVCHAVDPPAEGSDVEVVYDRADPTKACAAKDLSRHNAVSLYLMFGSALYLIGVIGIGYADYRYNRDVPSWRR